MSDPWSALGFEEYKPPGSGGAPLDDLGFEPAQTAPAPAPAPAQPQQPMGSLEMLATLAQRGGQGLYDGAVGFGQGLSMGGADELMGAMPGTSIEEQQALRRQSQARSPTSYNLGNAAGSVIPAALTSGMGALEQLGAAILQGGASGFLGSDGTPDERAQSGAIGAGVGGALSGASAGLSSAAGALRPYAQQGAERAQAAVEGLTGPAFRSIAKSNGLDGAQDLAREALETSPSHIIPRTTSWYRDQRAGLRDAAGQRVEDAVAALDAEVPQAINVDEYTQRLGDQGSSYLQSTIPEERAKAGVMNELRTNTSGKYATGQVGDVYLSPSELQAEKVALTQRGYPRNATATTSDADRADIYRDAASVPRQAIDEAAQRATTGTQGQYLNAMDDYGVAKTLADTTDRKAVMDASQHRGGMWDAFTGPVKDRIPDATSLALQGAEGGLGALERWASASQTGASMVGQGAGRMAGDRQSQRDQQNQQRERIQGASRGHMIEGTIEKLLDSEPELFGDYEGRFLEARGKSDPMAMSTLLQELQSDDTFRTQVLPQLKQRTSKPGDF
jgi:hypothetical protein